MNSNLQKKLFHFEAAPPQKTWEKISAALEKDTSFEQRLYAYKEAPPANTWTAIEKSLNDQTAKVVPFFTRYKTPLRYIAAASIVAVILTVVTINKQQNLSAVTANRVSPSASPRHTPSQNKQFTPEESGEDDNESNTTVAVTPPAHHEGLIKRTLAYIRPQNISPALAFRKNFIPQKAVEKALFDPSLDDFMVYSDADGNVMKLPKKLFSLVCCKDGDGSCNVRLQRLRQTLSANIAPVDFVGMIDMLRQLQ